MCQKLSQLGRRSAWLNSFFRNSGRERIYELWKKGQATHEEYRAVTKLCREKIRSVKAHLELNLVSTIKENKNTFININSK